MTRPVTIAAIIDGCRNGQRVYQKELVDRFGPQLFTIALRYVPDHAHAQDVLQDSFVKILTRIDQFKGDGSFEGWMSRVVVTTALNRLDRKWMRREVSREMLDHDTSVEPYVIDQLATEDIMRCVTRLPEGFRHVFNLYAIEGYRHREIGKMLGMTEVTSRSYYSRARKMLQALLSKHKIGLRHAE